jgi:hypothetical protein
MKKKIALYSSRLMRERFGYFHTGKYGARALNASRICLLQKYTTKKYKSLPNGRKAYNLPSLRQQNLLIHGSSLMQTAIAEEKMRPKEL